MMANLLPFTEFNLGINQQARYEKSSRNFLPSDSVHRAIPNQVNFGGILDTL